MAEDHGLSAAPVLVTDRMDLPAETIALIYKYRWQIELFFRWFKCILGCRHLRLILKTACPHRQSAYNLVDGLQAYKAHL